MLHTVQHKCRLCPALGSQGCYLFFFFFLFVAVKSEFKFVTCAVFLSQRGIKCGKADTIKDYTGGGAHTCVSKHGLISISLSREPTGC